MTILFGYHTAVYKKNRPARRSVFCGSCKIRVKRQTARDERCIPNEYPRFWEALQNPISERWGKQICLN